MGRHAQERADRPKEPRGSHPPPRHRLYAGHAVNQRYKGDCSYFSILLGGERSVNAVWSYEAPYAAVTAIKDYLAFYPNRVDTIEERPEA